METLMITVKQKSLNTVIIMGIIWGIENQLKLVGSDSNSCNNKQTTLSEY